MNLVKSVALITGGVQGLGRAIAEKLLKDGAKVVVADIKTDVGEKFQSEMNDKYGENRIKFMKCDVTNSDELSRTFEDTKSIFGSLNIVCNNAGIMTNNPKDAKKIIDINFTSVVEGTFKAIELMSNKSGGSGGLVVSTASAAGLGLMPGAPLYTSTKTGVVAFTRSFKYMGVEEEHGIRVNCLCPTVFDSELVRNSRDIFTPEHLKRFDTFGFLGIEHVIEAFMGCVHNEYKNGEVVAIYPGPRIFKVDFPPNPQFATKASQV